MAAATQLGMTRSSAARVYRSRLIKGGALVREMRLLTRLWDGKPGCTERLATENALSAPSRQRAVSAITNTFIPRFVRSRPPDLWRPLGELERAGWSAEQLLPLHYYATAASSPLIWDFVTEVLADRHARAQPDIRVDDAVRFILNAPASRFPDGRWGGAVTTRVAQGLLSTLRDFGVLAGAVKKTIAPLYLPTETFAFLVKLRQELGYKGGGALRDPCWSLFFMGETGVERFLFEAHQRRLLEYHAAGSLIRIDFPARTLHGYAHELTQRAH